MQARDAMKEIRAGRIAPVYAAFGKDRYRMGQFSSMLADKLLAPDERELGMVRFDTSETALEEIVAEAETLPFFVPRKLIVVRDSAVLCAAAKENGKLEHKAEKFLAYMEQPSETSVILFLVQAEKLDERRKIVKMLKDRNLIVAFPELTESELATWAVKRALDQKRTLNQEAAELLVARLGTGMQALAQEVDKLCLFAGEGGVIGREDVSRLTAATVEEDVFGLIDAIAELRMDRTLAMYRELLLRKEEPIRIAALVARQLRIMLQIKELERHRYSPQQMAGQLGLHPYAVKLAAEKARRFDTAVLGKHLAALADLDYRMKTGRVDKELGLQLFFLSMGADAAAGKV
ncbi:DNA polymerase III subunit delta [Paenibacillus pasadenensis]|uniref:DNA polymerase III subunit delta n=1 Tax=Paenibacillus pasadenensis TaxID=217090 RepID=UPI00203ED4B5|nr:DNA polymerase III subunit delta [Paenibacillus pasadenensis]MCM3746444.1 DNA polymerase III subunit delta [Paenibacillus pasadenensis]